MPSVKLKRSAVPSKVPLTTDLDLGEIALNTHDGKLFLKKDDGTPAIVEVGAIANDAVTNAKLANMAASTIKGRVTASTGDPEDLTASQARTVMGLATTDSPQFTAIELGHATDTTLSRSAAGVLAVESVVVPTISSTNTLTNKRVTPRMTSTTSTASPFAWNSDNADTFAFTALANDLTINADAGTPTDGQKVIFRFEPNTTGIDLTWTTGSSKSFRAIGITLPTALVNAKTTYVGCIYNSADSRWDAIATGSEA